jgi:hypothetical protein
MLARKLAADELGDERTVLPLDDLDNSFIAKDALRVDWPKFDTCIGNPPYLGRRRIIEEKGADYAAWLGEEFPEVGGVSDYVSYWFRKAHDLLPQGARAGLVTNTTRQGDTRKATLDYITGNDGVIYDAVSSQPWSGDAVVAVSIVNWTKGDDVQPKTLWLSDGAVKLEVDYIPGSLSPDIDVAQARPLRVNRSPKVCFQGQTPGHTEGFVLTREKAEELVGRDPVSAEVIHPFLTGEELNSTGRPGRYVIDIPSDDAASAARWKGALAHVRTHVLPTREARAEKEAERNREVLKRNPKAKPNQHHKRFLEFRWQQSYRRADMVRSIAQLQRYIALSIVAVEDRPSIYAFVLPDIWPAASLQVFAFEDDYSFGILTSQIHRRWFEARASSMRTDLRYTPNTVFDSFPWPQAPTDETAGALCDAVEKLLAYRDERLADGVTLGQQYASLRDPGRNELRRLHERLDAAVFDVYGFSSQDDVLAQVLALNESIAEEEAEGITQPRNPGNEGIAKNLFHRARRKRWQMKAQARQERLVQLGAALPAQAQAPELVQPREGALDDPAQLAQARAVLAGAPGDDGLDAASPERAAVLVVVIAAVGDQAVGAQTRPARLAADRSRPVDERQQLGDVVAVPAGQRDGQRDPRTVAEQMVLGARSATVNRRRPGQGPLEERGCGCRPRPTCSSRSRRRR